MIVIQINNTYNHDEEEDECYSPVLKHSEMSPTLSPKKGGGNE